MLNKIAWAILNPAALGLLAMVLSLCLWRCKMGRVIGVLGSLWLFLWSTPLVLRIVGVPLESDYALWNENGKPRMQKAWEYPVCDVIVDLGGGTGVLTNFYPGAYLNSSADRVYFSAQLWKAGKAPIVIPTGDGCVLSDGQFLQDLGVPASAILPENCARNTEENAKFVAKLLAQKENSSSVHLHLFSPPPSRAKPKVLLVTSAWHMKRSLLMFEMYASGIEVIPAPCDFECMNLGAISICDFVPNFDAAGRNSIYFHEWIGWLYYRWLR